MRISVRIEPLSSAYHQLAQYSFYAQITALFIKRVEASLKRVQVLSLRDASRAAISTAAFLYLASVGFASSNPYPRRLDHHIAPSIIAPSPVFNLKGLWLFPPRLLAVLASVLTLST
jgi:hypothetical protein